MTVVGSAYVEVLPDMSRFTSQLTAELKKSVDQAAVGASASFKGIASEGERALAGTANAAGKVTTELEKSGASAGGFLDKLKSLGGSSGPLSGFATVGKQQLAGLSAEAGSAGTAIEGIGAGALAASGPLVALLAVVTATAGFLAKGISQFEHSTEQVLAFQRVAGGTAEADSKLVASLNVLGIAPESVSRGFFLLSKTIEQHQSKLTDLGITVARTKDGQVDLEGTLLNVGDAFKGTQNQAERNNIAFTAFGRSGLALIPVLSRSRSELEELNKAAAAHHLVFTQAELDAGEKLKISTGELTQAFKGLEIEAAQGLIPGVIRLVSEFTGLLGTIDKVGNKINDLAKPIGGLGGLFKDVLTVTGPGGAVIDFLGKMSSGSDKAAKAQQELAAAASADAQSQAELKKELDSVTTASSQLVDKQFAADAAARSVRDSNKALADSTQQIADAHANATEKQDAATKSQRDYNALVLVGGADLTAYADAVRKVRDLDISLEQATNGVQDALDGQKSKQYDLNVAIGTYGPNSQQAIQAATALRDATVNVDVANNRVLDTKDDLTKAHKDQSDAAAGSAASLERLATARDNLRKTDKEARDAVQAEADLRAKIPDLVEAQNEAYYHQATANSDLRNTQELATGATQDFIDKNADLKDELGKIAATLDPKSPLRANLSTYISDLQTAGQANTTITGVASGGALLGTLAIPGVQRGAGGPLEAGQFSIVGESGPEIVGFPTAARVFSNTDSRRMIREANREANGASKGPASIVMPPPISIGPFHNVDVDPLHLASRIAFEFVAPTVPA